MRLRPYHWLLALMLASVAHIELARWLQPSRTAAAGGGPEGIEISLAVSAAADGEAVKSSAEPLRQEVEVKAVQEVKAVEKAAPKKAPAPTRSRQKKLDTATSDTKPEQAKKTQSRSTSKPAPATRKKSVDKTPASKPAQPAKAGKTQTGAAARAAVPGPAVDKAAEDRIRRDYIIRLSAWLNRHKRYPRRAQRRQQQGTVKLRFVLDRSGNVLNAAITGSSSHSLLDQAALDMLRRAAPLPAFPAGLAQRQLEVVLPVSFNLR